MILIILAVAVLNLFLSIIMLALTHLAHKPVRAFLTSRAIADEAIVLAERSNLKGMAKLHAAVDFAEVEGKRSRIKHTRNEWAKLIEIRLAHAHKVLK